MSESEKRAPVQRLKGGIPWDMHLRAYDAYSKRWGPQPAMIDLEDRGCRGGFAIEELDSFIPGWRQELEQREHVKLERDPHFGTAYEYLMPVAKTQAQSTASPPLINQV